MLWMFSGNVSHFSLTLQELSKDRILPIEPQTIAKQILAFHKVTISVLRIVAPLNGYDKRPEIIPL